MTENKNQLTHTIKEGDTLWDMAKLYGLTVDELQKLNPGKFANPDLIYPGDELLIADGTRIDPPAKPAPKKRRSSIDNMPCVPIEYVDLVYFPNHPKTNKQAWLLLTQEAQDAFVSEEGYFKELNFKFEQGDSNNIKKMKQVGLKKLNRLGLLDSFLGVDDSQFLPDLHTKRHYRDLTVARRSLQESINHKQALFELYSNEPLSDPLETFHLLSDWSEKNNKAPVIPKSHWSDYQAALDKAKADFAKDKVEVISRASIGQQHNIEDLKLIPTRELSDLAKKWHDYNDDLEREINALSQQARTAAQQFNINHELKYAWYEPKPGEGYYSSDKDVQIQKLLRQYNNHQSLIDKALVDYSKQSLSSQRLKALQQATQGQPLEPGIVESHYYFKVQNLAQNLANLQAKGMVVAELALNPADLTDFTTVTPKVTETSHDPNKQQVAKALEKSLEAYDYASLIKEDGKLDDEAQNALYYQLVTLGVINESANSIEVDKSTWGLYPLQKLEKRLKATIDNSVSELNSMLGTKTPKAIFRPMLQCQLAVIKRLDALKMKAQKRISEQHTIEPDNTPISLTAALLWEPKEWKPQRYSAFFNLALATHSQSEDQKGMHYYMAVECYRSSNKGKASYVRCPTWFTDIDNDESLYVKSVALGKLPELPGLNSSVALNSHAMTGLSLLFGKLPAIKKLMADNQEAASRQQAGAGSNNSSESNPPSGRVAKALAPLNERLKAGLGQYTDALQAGAAKALMQDLFGSSDGALHGKTETVASKQSTTFAHDPMGHYDVSGEAQFLRFTAEGSAGNLGDQLVSTTTDKATGKTDGIKGSLGLFNARLGVDLLRGQISAKSTWPDDKGEVLTFYYEVETKDPQHPIKSCQAKMGFLKLNAGMQLYGMVGASCALGGGLEFGVGPQGTMGIRGASEVKTDATVYGKQVQSEKHIDNTAVERSMSASGKVNAEAFAGMEFGGLLYGECQWQPPGDSRFKTLCRLDVSARVSVGAGGAFNFWIGYSHGKLLWVMKAHLVLGSGAGGKFAFVVDTDSLVDFVNMVQRMVAGTGFKRVTFIGSPEEHDAFLKEHPDGETTNTFEFITWLITGQFSGLALAELILMPFAALKALGEETLNTKNAPALARFVDRTFNPAAGQEEQLDQQQLAARRLWIMNLFPEVRTKVLHSVLHLQEYDPKSWDQAQSVFSASAKEQLTAAKNQVKIDNADQRDAIVYLLTNGITEDSLAAKELILKGGVSHEEAAANQYIETLERCDLDAKNDNRKGKGQNYWKTWQRILEFMAPYINSNQLSGDQIDFIMGLYRNHLVQGKIINKHFRLFSWVQEIKDSPYAKSVKVQRYKCIYFGHLADSFDQIKEDDRKLLLLDHLIPQDAHGLNPDWGTLYQSSPFTESDKMIKVFSI